MFCSVKWTPFTGQTILNVSLSLYINNGIFKIGQSIIDLFLTACYSENLYSVSLCRSFEKSKVSFNVFWWDVMLFGPKPLVEY